MRIGYAFVAELRHSERSRHVPAPHDEGRRGPRPGRTARHPRGAGAAGRPGPVADPGARLGRLSHRPSRRDGRLAGQTQRPLHPRPRGRGRGRRPRRRRHPSEEGDRVGAPWLHTACGRCTHCVGGWETLCESQQNTGYSVDGGYAEYVRADANYVGRIPDGLEFGPAAPVLCAGVTVYKGLKELEATPGDWVAISGIGGLGHMAVQYAKAMGYHVVAVDIHADKLRLARELGADLALHAVDDDPVGELQRQMGGVRGALVTAVSNSAFAQAVGMLRRGGFLSLVGLPPGDFPLPIFEVVLKRITVRGSIVGTRNDLAESLAFAAEGKVASHFSWDELENINAIFGRMQEGTIDGRVVLRI
jgi:propanol-preferring alcohol dehydrogenase